MTDDDEPTLVRCRLRCRCGHRSELALPGDAPAKATLASITCESCRASGSVRFDLSLRKDLN